MGLEYLRTGPGILQILEELFNLMSFAIIAASDWKTTRGDWFLGCSIIAFIITGLLLLGHVFDVIEKVNTKWWMIQAIYCCLWAVFYIVTSALLLDGFTVVNIGSFESKWSPDEYTAAGSIGVIATVLYIIEAIFRLVLKAN